MYKAQILSSEETIFYAIEKTIKSYRRYAQNQLKTIVLDITIDQLLVLGKINQIPSISHADLSDLIFKDMASISRMLTLLEKRNYILRDIDPDNRRRFITKVTPKGKSKLKKLAPQVLKNREKALHGISEKEMATCMKILNRISNNINPEILYKV